MIDRWVRFWDRTEHPMVLGMLRIGVAAVLLYDLLYVWAIGLVHPLFAASEHGGLSLALSGSSPPLVYRLFGGDGDVAVAMHAAMVIAALSLLMGFFTRTSAWVLLLLSAQHAALLPPADRGIDMLMRNVLMLLGLSAAGRWMSLDALRATGRFTGDGAPAPAWPRTLMILQLVVMYFTAGVQKYAMHWWPWGEYSALYVILHDWAYARFDFRSLLQQTWAWRLTQLSSAVTMAYQLTYPTVLGLLWLQRHPERGGRLGRWAVRNHAELLWIGLGTLFHLGIFGSMQLGIFPSGMLVTYVVFFSPEQWEALWRRLRP